MKLKQVTYRQEFRLPIVIGNQTVLGEDLWHLVQGRDARKAAREDGEPTKEVLVQNRHGRSEWMDWEKEVEVAEHSV